MKFPRISIKEGVLEAISFSVLLISMFLLLTLIIPGNLVSFQYAKSFILILGTCLSFILYILHVLKKGTLVFPKSWWMLSLAAIPITYLISAILSENIGISFFGYGVEYDSFVFVFVVTILSYLIMQVFASSKRIFYAYTVFILAMVLIFIFHILRFIFGADFLSFNLFTDITASTFGKWNDLAVLAGLVTILSTLFVETTKASKELKIVSYIIFALSIVFLMAVNFSVVWITLGILSLISFVYLFSYRGDTKKVPILSTTVLILSVVFLIAGDYLGGFIWGILGTNIVDIQPGAYSTYEVIKATFSNTLNTIFGSGPNTFVYQWQYFKPDAVNQTALWNADFGYGFSYLITSLVTVGVLGFIAWVSFIINLIYQWLKSITVVKEQGSFVKYLVLSSFISSIFLWTMLAFHVPGIVVFSLTFFFTGLFLASLVVSGTIKQKEVEFIKSPRLGFITTLISVSLIVCLFGVGFVSFQRVLASTYYQKSSRLLNEGDVITSGNTMAKAVNLYPGDIYYQALAELNFIQFNRIFNNEDLNQNSVLNRAQQALGLAVSNAQSAVESNPLNYQNYIVLGNLYSSVIPIEIPGAVDGALGAYESAIDHSPKNPSLYIAIARLYMNQGDIDSAREWVNRSLTVKNNYTEAIFILAQIEIAAGNVDEAISSVEIATLIEPNNPAILFQLGILYYDKEDYRNASNSFERAIELAGEYANAKYFLGLTYYELGRVSDAIDVFVDLREGNPDNEELKVIIDNLRRGSEPFASAETEPEEREELPLEEESL